MPYIENKTAYFSEEFAQILDDMTADFKSEKARSTYLNLASAITRYCKKDFLELTKEDVTEYFSKKNALSDSTKASNLSRYRSMAAKADEKFGTELSSCFAMETPPQIKELSLQGLPSFCDIDIVLTSLKEKEDMQTFLLITLVLETALSTGDLASLDLKNIYTDKTDNPYIRFEPAVEGAMPRFVPISKNTSNLIGAVLLSRNKARAFPEDSLFVNKYGGRLSGRLMEKNLRDACIDAKVKPFTLNDLKTLSSAKQLKEGIPADVLAQRLGTTGFWFFRLNGIVAELEGEPMKYNHLEVKW